jgi:chaperone required for assembly of F1-ATPase
MRDIFDDLAREGEIDPPADPMQAARRAMRTLRRRFYGEASVADSTDGHAVVLDNRPIRTPARHPLTLPTRPLAEAVAAEWQGQGEFIDPARMPLTRLTNTIIDGVTTAPQAVADEVVKYLASDLIFYRVDTPEGLVGRQASHWDPLIAWARDDLGARFVLAEGVMHVTQPDHALAAATPAVPRDPWRLGAVHSITTLTGSALIALAVAHARVSPEAAWAAAHVDEDWNMDQWGQDPLAIERRAFRFAEMRAAATVLALTQA